MSDQGTLIDLIKKGLQYDRSWGIYALGTGKDSPARIGQTQFDFGGLKDGKEFVIDGERLGNAIAEYLDNDPEAEIQSWSEFLDWMIEEGWIDYDNPECYQADPGCPKCNGPMHGADFPNGGNHGACLLCGNEAEWDNDNEGWK